jgi:hypothetical protein
LIDEAIAALAVFSPATKELPPAALLADLARYILSRNK